MQKTKNSFLQEAKEQFFKYLDDRNLRQTLQREKILDLFLKTEGHATTDEFYRMLKEKHPNIGYTTVYRTLKLFCESGIAREVNFGDGMTRFEHKYGHKHHDHLVCLKCGRNIEVSSPEIEKLQDKLCEKHRFKPLRHEMKIFGICQRCRK